MSWYSYISPSSRLATIEYRLTAGLDDDVRVWLRRVCTQHCASRATSTTGLSSFKFSWWAVKDAPFVQYCNRVHYDSWRSFKVVDFGNNRKSLHNFLLANCTWTIAYSNVGPFKRYCRFSTLWPIPIPVEIWGRSASSWLLSLTLGYKRKPSLTIPKLYYRPTACMVY